MIDQVADWANLFLRWAHVIVGIVWIGESFYFIGLDNSLGDEGDLPPRVKGEAWQVHGGGFYRMSKYLVAPERMPGHLHWFKYESYFTWITGFALLVVIYYADAGAFLIDPEVQPLKPVEAIAISLAGLAAGWIAYDWLCRSRRIGGDTALLAAAVFALLVFQAWAFGEVFSGRGAFLHVGAAIGTIMTANVFFVIIPNQKKVVAALGAGREPEAWLGAQAGQRSLHNNYLTLPVILMMVSGHYPELFGHPYGWAVVALVLLLGGSVRHFFNSRKAGAGIERLALYLAAVVALGIGLAAFVEWRPDIATHEGEVSDARVLQIVTTRCMACHAERPADPDFDEAPGEVRLESLADIARFAAKIREQAVLATAMPLGNKTRMTAEERAELGAWIGGR